MAHFAEINENNDVVRIIVIPDEQEHRGQDFCAIDLGLGGTWLQTSYNTIRNKHLLGGVPLRKNYAGGTGYKYDPIRDAFIPPKPYSKWVLDEETCDWVAPVAYPTDGKYYLWNDNIGNWEESNY